MPVPILQHSYPAVQLALHVDSIKTKSLHLTEDKIIYRGDISGNFPVTDPDHLKGDLTVTKTLLVRNDQRFEIDSIALSAGATDSGQYLHLGGDMLSVLLQGHYRLSEMGSVLQQSLQPYFSVMHDSSMKRLAPYDFAITARIWNRPVWKAILPDLQRMDSINFDSHFADSGWECQPGHTLAVYGI